MNSEPLREHDANQGAQSSGEFLGMTGNSGWYLLGSSGATVLMVVFLWGVLGVSLLLCLLAGVILCGLSVTYVFTLKNNKPEHYDTDFFESALVEAGVVQFAFGPRWRRPANPFAGVVGAAASASAGVAAAKRAKAAAPNRGRVRTGAADSPAHGEPLRVEGPTKSTAARSDEEQPTVARSAYERVQEQLTSTEELMEEALAERGED